MINGQHILIAQHINWEPFITTSIPQANRIIPILLHLLMWVSDSFLSVHIYLHINAYLDTHVYLRVWISLYDSLEETSIHVWDTYLNIIMGPGLWVRANYQVKLRDYSFYGCSHLHYMAPGQIHKQDDYFAKCFWLITRGNQKRKNEWIKVKIAQLLRNKYLKTCIHI